MPSSRRLDDPAREYQLAFLRRVLPSQRCRILEAGCGSGALAALLINEGYEVTAIDGDEGAVESARSGGVPALQADFTSYGSEASFEVVLFSRSLHHIHPLDVAVDRAHSLLAPGGLLVADEFAVDWADADTAAWFYDQLALLEAAGYRTPDSPTLPPGDPMVRWHRDHEEERPLHRGAEMLDAIARQFSSLTLEKGPFLYRYLARSTAQHDRAAQVARQLLDVELRRINEGSLAPTGLRVVARRESD